MEWLDQWLDQKQVSKFAFGMGSMNLVSSFEHGILLLMEVKE